MELTPQTAAKMEQGRPMLEFRTHEDNRLERIVVAGGNGVGAEEITFTGTHEEREAAFAEWKRTHGY